MASILLGIEDGDLDAEPLRRALAADGHEIAVRSLGRDLLDIVGTIGPDLIIVLEKAESSNSLDLCRALGRESAAPVFLVAARASEFDRILALELGADDILVRPVGARELAARVRAFFRRVKIVEQRLAGPPGGVLRSGGLVVDRVKHQVHLDGRPVQLNPREFELLAFLVGHAGQVFTRAQLIHAIWGQEIPNGSRTVDIHVRYLREKIERDSANPTRLLTIRGVGYRFAVASDGVSAAV